MTLTDLLTRPFRFLAPLIVFFHAVLLLHSHAFSLPYLDHPDEPAFYLAGQVWLGNFEMGSYMRGYPPAYIAFEVIVAQALTALGFPHIAQTVHLMRLIAVVVSLGTLWLIFSAARSAGGDWAALLAGLVWVVSPNVLEHGVYATVDPLVYFALAWALWLSICAVHEHKPARALWAMGVGALAVFLKFQVVPALLAGIAAWMILARQPRLGLRILAGQIALVAMTAVILLGVVRAENLLTPYEDSLPSSEIGIIRSEGVGAMFEGIINIQRVLTNLSFVFLPLGTAAALIILSLGALAWLAAAASGVPRADWRVIVLCLAAMIAVPWVMAAFTEIKPWRLRDALPASTALAVLMGLAVRQFWQLMATHWLRQAIFAALGLIWLVGSILPQVQTTLQVAQARHHGDWRAVIRQWADANVPADWVAVPSVHQKTFNPFWGGVQGRQWFDWLQYEGHFTDKPLSYWQTERSIGYVLITTADDTRLRQDAAKRAYLDSLLRLKTFSGPPYLRGPETVFYRLAPIQQPMQAVFGGEIALRGVDLAYRQGEMTLETAAEADVVQIRPYWQAILPPSGNYSVYLHLTRADSREVLAQADGAPSLANRPTLTWLDRDEVILGGVFNLPIPMDLPSGEYRVLLGLYDYTSGARLTLPSGADFITLAQFSR